MTGSARCRPEKRTGFNWIHRSSVGRSLRPEAEYTSQTRGEHRLPGIVRQGMACPTTGILSASAGQQGEAEVTHIAVFRTRVITAASH